MRLFQALLLDVELSAGYSLQKASDAWACLLSRAESLRFTCIVDQVGGTSPTFSLNLYGSAIPNGAAVYAEKIVLLNAAALVSGPNALTASYLPTDPTNPPSKELFVEASIGGTGQTAHVRVWVCGRGPQLLEALAPVSPTFAAQYSAARMTDDQNRLPGRKRALPQGASLFYPPELFFPSLTWER